jgi:hypothetical protein
MFSMSCHMLLLLLLLLRHVINNTRHVIPY